MEPVRRCLFLWCHGKVQGLFAIWYTWQCCDSINIPFNAIYSSRGNHHGLWWTIIHGWNPFSFPRWLCVCVCVVYWQKGCFITRELYEIVSLCWQSHSEEGLFDFKVEHVLFVSLSYTPTLSVEVSVFVLFNSNAHMTGHTIIVSVSWPALQSGTQRCLTSWAAQMRLMMSSVGRWSAALDPNARHRVKARWRRLFGKKITWHEMKTSREQCLIVVLSSVCFLLNKTLILLFVLSNAAFKNSTLALMTAAILPIF